MESNSKKGLNIKNEIDGFLTGMGELLALPLLLLIDALDTLTLQKKKKR